MAESDVLPPLRTRQQLFDYFEGHAVESMKGLYRKRSFRGLVKSYMLETVGDSSECPSIERILNDAGLQLTAIEDGLLYLVSDPQFGGAIAVVEKITNRFPVIYTMLGADKSDFWVQDLVIRSPWLDQLWISAPIFRHLWDHVKLTTPDKRYTRLGFDYTNQYEPSDEQKDQAPNSNRRKREYSYDSPEYNRTTSRFTLVDRIRSLNNVLPSLYGAYSPLFSLTQLRVPGVNHGGHDFYFDGKVTNRSDSFADHRQNITFFINGYRSITEQVERTAWFAGRAKGRKGFTITGAAVYFEFSEALETQTFQRWIKSTFSRANNRFRLLGKPELLGPNKVQVLAVDAHLWQPIQLELTTRHVLALLPEGTCGNTIHRLVTNIQRLIDPRVRVWLGDSDYEEIVSEGLTTESA